MSDRSMRLKYLTKMKIILCIFLLYITAVSVFGQTVELNGIVGNSTEFPTKVETGGNLMYGGKVIGCILSGTLLPLTTPEYQGRVQWDSSTGLFSLSGLRLEDSGVYTVETDRQKSVSTFSLTVWIPVSKPHVSTTRDEHPCALLCTVERETGATLSWYREGEEKPYGGYPIRNAQYLDLPVPVERSGVYTCKAKNSVSSETSDPLTVGAHCTGSNTGVIVGIVVCVIAFAVALISVYFCSKRRDPTSSRVVLGIPRIPELMAIERNLDAQLHAEAQEPGSQGL